MRKLNLEAKGKEQELIKSYLEETASEELARKSTAIINACQYSFIFSLAPNDMHDLCKLYEIFQSMYDNEIFKLEAMIEALNSFFSLYDSYTKSSDKVVPLKNSLIAVLKYLLNISVAIDAAIEHIFCTL